jgi:hypothetical protein
VLLNSKDSTSVNISVRAETVLVCQCKSRGSASVLLKSKDSASVSISVRAETVIV